MATFNDTTRNEKNSASAGPIIGYILLGLIIAYLVIWYLFRIRFWYRTSKCISVYSCICGWICCWKHEIRKPPHTGLFAGNGRKSRATHVALCFPHNPLYPLCPTGCPCDPCCDDSVESRNQQRRHWDPEAHPWGLGCAIPCCPVCCIRCLCEDELDERIGPSIGPNPQTQERPVNAPDSKSVHTASRNVQMTIPDQSPAPPAYDEVVRSQGNLQDAAPHSSVDDEKKQEVSPAEAAKVLAKFAVRGVSNLASSVVQTAKNASKSTPKSLKS